MAGDRERRRSSAARQKAASAPSTPQVKPTRDMERFAARQRRFCYSAVTELMKDENSVNFSRPVLEMWSSDDLPGYAEQIKEPMDLGTVLSRVEDKSAYNFEEVPLFNPDAFSRELRLTFENAMQYNDKDTDMHRISAKFLRWFNSFMKDLPTEFKRSSGSDTKSFKAANVLVVMEKMNNGGSAGGSGGGGGGGGGARGNGGTDGGSDAEAGADADAAGRPAGSDVDTNANGGDDDAEEIERLLQEVASLREERAAVDERLAKADVERNLPLSEKERIRLRKEVESLPWERCKRVVEILRATVDEVLANSGEESPDYVDIDLDTVAPHKLREVAEFLHPSAGGDRAAAQASVDRLDARIEEISAQLPRGAESRHRKRGRDVRDRDRRRRKR